MALYTEPSERYMAVTPHDTNALALGVARGFYIGGAGNIALQDDRGTNVTFVGVLAGEILPVRASIVRSTNTTATNIVALY